jgi:hypothetical protein
MPRPAESVKAKRGPGVNIGNPSRIFLWQPWGISTVRRNGDGMYIGLRIIGVCGLLSACATNGAIVEAAGAGPDLTQGATFTVDFARTAGPDPSAAALAKGAVADSDIPKLLERRLSDRGMAPAAGASGRYLVEIAYVGRPSTVGAYVDTASASADRPNWLDAPQTRGWRRADRRICTLTARFTVAATGAEVFRVSAREDVGKAACETATARLLDAALAKLPILAPAAA